MIDQEKIGGFLRDLRKEKGQTQEEIAEMLGTSSRSVSRWETGRTLPDLAILVELADYYNVDIKDIINGGRESEIMEKEKKETLLKVAEYADKQKKQAILRAVILFSLEMVCCGYTIAMGIMVLQSDGKLSAGYAVIPMLITFVFSGLVVINAKDYVKTRQE